MNTEKNNEIDIAKWLSGELTPEEKHAFEQTEDYKAYAKIINATDKLHDPAYDEDAVLSKIQQKITVQPKVRKLNSRYVYSGIAAALVLLFGLYFFLNNTAKSITTDFGQQFAFTLPDGSEVTLNSKSTLSYDKANFSNERILHLDGEAYFKVTKGSSFKVITDEGMIEVLGTQFNVDTNDDFFEVRCYSGKVKVVNDQKVERILTKGKAHQTYKNAVTDWDFDAAKTLWIAGTHTFSNTPFLQVIDALENQYEITIENSEIYKDERFTGRFSNTNFELALQTVFEAMNITYTLKDNTITLSKK
ncbi:FecR family protein [uncultured Kordia sp.]|uniref:FecR family protein n=1 Tax=uncultured Kordia sp. TaxID=507699 RepID=UPI002605A146|nr:FecR family protein [uncultured Kordia sp.]